MTDPSLRRLARLLDGLQREVRDLQLAPRAAYTSVPVEQDDGTVAEVSVPEMVTTATEASATAAQAVEQAAQASAQAVALDATLAAARQSLEETASELDARLTTARTDLDAANENLTAITGELAEAITVANGAASLASAAQTDIDAVPRIVHATTAPDTEAAPTGSTWFQHAETLAGAVIGQWSQAGEGSASQWVPVQLASDVIAGLDVGKLTAGSATVVEAVAQRIAAATAAFQTADIGNLFVTGTSTVDTQVAQQIFTARLAVQKILASEVLIGSMNLLQYVPGQADSVNGIGETATHVVTDGGRSSFRVGYNTTATTMRYGSLRPYATYAIGDFALGDVLAVSFRAAKGGGLGGGTQTPNNLTATLRIQSDQGYAVLSNTMSVGLGSGFADYVGELTVTTDPTTATATNGSGVVAAGTNPRIFVHIEQAYPAGTSGWAWLNSVRITRKIDANLIVDGAIRGRSLAADAIDGKTITSAVIQTNANAIGVGTAIRIVGSQIDSWSGSTTTRLTAGGIHSYSTVPGSDTYSVEAYLRAGNLVVQDKSGDGTVGQKLVVTQRAITFTDADTDSPLTITAPTLRVNGGPIDVMGAGTLARTASTTVTLAGAGGATLAVGAGVNIPTAYATTTTSTANVFITSAGALIRSTSLRAEKLLIEDAPPEWATRVLDLRPRTWIDRGNVERYAASLSRRHLGEPEPDDPTLLGVGLIDQRIPGLVAEEVEQVIPELCTYDDAGALNGVAYDRLAAALILTLRDVVARLDALEGATS